MRARSLYRDGPLTEELTSFFGGERTLGDPELRTLLLAVLHNTVTDSVWPLNNFTGAKYNRADRYLKDPPDRNLDLSLTTVIRGSTAAPMYFAPSTSACSAAIRSAPRAPPAMRVVPSPTCHPSIASRIADVTLGISSAGNRGGLRSGASTMCPLTTIIRPVAKQQRLP
jgi:hypothetical protein